MEPGFEVFDHTADVGVRVFAPSLAGLVRPAGEGLYAVIGELAAGGSERRLRLEFADQAPALLLRDYLAELLALFEREQRMVTAPEVEEFRPGRLAVVAATRQADPARSSPRREVKAVTYHQLDLRRTADGYQATFILDI